MKPFQQSQPILEKPFFREIFFTQNISFIWMWFRMIRTHWSIDIFWTSIERASTKITNDYVKDLRNMNGGMHLNIWSGERGISTRRSPMISWMFAPHTRAFWGSFWSICLSVLFICLTIGIRFGDRQILRAKIRRDTLLYLHWWLQSLPIVTMSRHGGLDSQQHWSPAMNS